MIRFSYDEGVRAAYLKVSDGSEEHAAVKRTDTVLEEKAVVNLDFDEDGNLYGVEVLLPAAEEGK